jgi:hypothetical protein
MTTAASTQAVPTTPQPIKTKRVRKPRPVFTVAQRVMFAEVLKQNSAEAKAAGPKPHQRRKEPEAIPKTGEAKGALATYEHKHVTVTPDAAETTNWVREIYAPVKDGVNIYIPLLGMPHIKAAIHATDRVRLAALGFQVSRWILDEATGSIRACRKSSMGDDPNHSFDIVAALYGLQDGDSYTMAEPYDLRQRNITIHRAT